MTDQADQETREAREWAEYITSLPDLHGGYLQHALAAARFVLANTTPVLPDPLFLAKATHPEYGEGVVSSHFPSRGGYVRFMFLDEKTSDGTPSRWVEPSELTFHTPETPDHPVFLRTEEDYASAPEGTVVAEYGAMPIVLLDDLWREAGTWERYHDDMAGTRRRVLRWGWPA